MTVKSMMLVLEEKKCCDGLLDDDVVSHCSLCKKNLEKLLKKVHKWANLNKMTFDIEKIVQLWL